MENVASTFARVRSTLERERSACFLSRWLFLRLLGLSYLIAFVSLWTQIDGLAGHNGILPVADYLQAVTERVGPERYWRLPTFSWFDAGDGFLHFQCAAGAVLSLLLIVGFAPVPALKWKPGDLMRRPAFVAPHQLRLDWQMWFAALGDYRGNPWFVNFLIRLLEGSPEVLALLEKNPFPDHPPVRVRAVLYEYQFTDFAQRRANGEWWRRERKGLYCPEISLRQNVPEPARASQQ
jgi:hypothetical protein